MLFGLEIWDLSGTLLEEISTISLLTRWTSLVVVTVLYNLAGILLQIIYLHQPLSTDRPPIDVVELGKKYQSGVYVKEILFLLSEQNFNVLLH
jgi:hypothetical protein